MTGPPDPRPSGFQPSRPWLGRTLVSLGVALLLALLWFGGLLWFASVIPTQVDDQNATTDAIVVLTGGSGRLKAGIDLLNQGKAKKLFVSGVYRGIDVDELLRLARVAPKPLECCVALGHAADSTNGNAAETARWMAAEGFKSLRLVTSAYHMPRSLIEFHRAMPGLRIVPNPVFADNVKQRWWLWTGTGNLVIGEYHKYLFALLHDAFARQLAAGS
jgi:uncharacterized SAM-binding protein YcdF (DUF218 family)